MLAPGIDDIHVDHVTTHAAGQAGAEPAIAAIGLGRLALGMEAHGEACLRLPPGQAAPRPRPPPVTSLMPICGNCSPAAMLPAFAIPVVYGFRPLSSIVFLSTDGVVVKAFSAPILASLLAIAAMIAFMPQPLQDTYPPDAVKITAEGVTESGVILVFRPPSEDDHYCPGIRYRQIDTTFHYEFVRTPKDDQADVDLSAESREDGNLAVTFPFPDATWESDDSLELVDEAGRRHGAWTNVTGSMDP